MTKQNFENLKNNLIYCKHCKRDLPKDYFSYSYVKSDCTASKCKYCDWLIRHNGINTDLNYSKDFLEKLIEDMIFEKERYLNELAKQHQIGLDELILIIKNLKIGNKKLTIKSKCQNCGKDVDVVLSVYEKNKNTFCSTDCYYEYKKNNAKKGKDNEQYKRIETKCSNCGKNIEVIPYDYNNTNSFGDRHNFCSQECYWEFRRKYYVGEKHANYNRILTIEEKERLRQNLLNSFKKSNRLNTKIQLKTNSILEKNKINYEREYRVKYYSIDNYLKDSKLMIEVMGDYWHSSPVKYGENKYFLNNIQYKGIIHDKQKHSYILNHLNIEILYLWESDIKNDVLKCELLILEYIKNNGILSDYNSFNYTVDNGVLKLNSQIIIPYLKRSAEEIKKYLKTSA